MNPQLHDEFVALCALFYSGDITDEEWALLQVHLAYCDPCRQEFEQYKQVHKDVIPLMAASAAAEASGPQESAAAFAKAEGDLLGRVKRSPVPAAPTVPKNSVHGLGIAIAACVGGLVVFAGMHLSRRSSTHTASVVPAPRSAATLPASSVAPDNSQTPLALKQNQDEVVELRGRIAELEKQSTESTSAASSLRQQFESERANREQIAASQSALTGQLASAQAEIESLQAKLASTEGASSEQVSQVATLQTKVHRLDSALDDANTALDDKDRMLALDKDLLSHDRDIRDLIGARDLYIADIFDTTESGKTAKPFGRIFYTRDRSLIFYGFDLEKQPGAKEQVAFQAWGSGADRQPVSLGLFYQDDGHKRWVLRCDDAKTLARLNMVFVTIEPPGGSNHPTGKQLLRAYLQIQPNHP